MKNYSIVRDEENQLRVIPSKWLTDGKKAMFWPLLTKKTEINDAVMKMKDCSTEWEKYPVKYIKSNDSYTDAIADTKIPNLDDLTDASDTDKIKQSRSLRHKRKIAENGKADEETANKMRKSRHDQETGKSSLEQDENSEENSEDKSEDENCPEKGSDLHDSSLENNVAPKSLDVSGKKNRSAADKSKDTSTPKKSIDVQRDNVTIEAEPVVSINEPMSTVKDMTDREILMATYGLVVKLVEKTNSNSIKIGKLDLKLGSIPRKNAPNDIVLTMDDIAMLNKFFPVDTKEDHTQKKIDVVEEKLSDKNKVFFQKVVYFLKNKGGSDYKKLIFNMLYAMMTNEVANTYSFTGRKSEKKAFAKLKLYSCIYQACKLVYNDIPDDDINRAISSWLDASNTRIKRESSGASKGANKFIPISLIPEIDSD